MEQDKLQETAALSKMLQVTMIHANAWRKAVEAGYITLAPDGVHLQWTLGSLALLAYFCGRVWSDDRCALCKRKGARVWRLGAGTFPGTELNTVFGQTLLRQTRNKRKNLPLPTNHRLLDVLFS